MSSIKAEILTHAKNHAQEGNKKLLAQVFRHHKRTGEGIGSIFSKLASVGFKWLPSLFRGAKSIGSTVGSAALSGLKRVGTTAKSISSKVTSASRGAVNRPASRMPARTLPGSENSPLAISKTAPTEMLSLNQRDRLAHRLPKLNYTPSTPKVQLPRPKNIPLARASEDPVALKNRMYVESLLKNHPKPVKTDNGQMKKAAGVRPVLNSDKAEKQRAGIAKIKHTLNVKAPLHMKGGRCMSTGSALKAIEKGGIIVRENDEYKLLSHKGRNLGTFSTVAKAKNREKQIQYFKNAATTSKA